jgi:antibiotic biosynthesis monooxygenase (ABM) superfamily enzyme
VFSSRTKTPLPYTAIEAIEVPSELDAKFVDWDRRYNNAMSDVPGFLGSETMAPALPEQPEWIVTVRWATRDDMLRFAESDTYRAFENEGAELRTHRSSVNFFEGEPPTPTEAERTVTSLLYWKVVTGMEKEFRDWHSDYARAMSESTGFQGYQLQEPVEELGQTDWVEAVRWESVFARDGWIRSDTRRRMFELGQEYFTDMRARNARTSFEGWFRFDSSTAGSPVPTWKQSMVVLLILYPTVFLLSVYATNPLEWPLWAGLFLGNVLSVSLMGFIITPLVMRYVLGWWLNPPPTASPERERNGFLLVVTCYVVFLVVFSVWPIPAS